MTAVPHNKIKNRADLQRLLNDTLELHRYKGWTAWEDACDAGLSVAAKAKLFGVNWKTANNWSRVYEAGV